ncbi:hypothetical protein F7P69_24890 [Cellulosimicrobium funkei]|nr:hypothetical protein [Cellulosimicrobium funkei]
MRARSRPQPWQWQNVSGALMLLRLEDYSGPMPADPPRRIPRFIIALCILVAAMGLFMMVMSGISMAEGDFTSSGSGRSRGITPPIAFAIGLGLAVSPYFIIRQERNSGSTRSAESWGSVLALYPEGVALHEGPLEGSHPWEHVSPEVLDAVPEPGRAVVGHYQRHPEDRAELGTEAAERRAHSGR